MDIAGARAIGEQAKGGSDGIRAQGDVPLEISLLEIA